MFLAVSTALMTPERFASAKRVALGGVLLYVLWALAGNVSFFAAMQTRQHREHQELLRTMELRREREATILRQKSEFLARQRLEPKLHTGEQRTKTKQRAAQNLQRPHSSASSSSQCLRSRRQS